MDKEEFEKQWKLVQDMYLDRVVIYINNAGYTIANKYEYVKGDYIEFSYEAACGENMSSDTSVGLFKIASIKRIVSGESHAGEDLMLNMVDKESE